jgi:hypothetical protein
MGTKGVGIMNLTAFSLSANSNPEVDENQEMELTFGSLSFYIGPSGSTRLSDPMKSALSASKIERMTASGSSVGSSSEANSPVSLAAIENLQGKLEEPDEIGQETIVEEAVDKSRDIASRSNGVSRSVHQLCVIITEAAEEEKNHTGNKEVDMQVDKIRSNGKKEKEKVHVSAGEWRMIMIAVNHGTDVPADSRREVLMGYQYVLHQRKKKLRQERDMIMRSPGYNSTPSEGYWSEYSNSSESSMERRRDPKHNRRITAQIREESYAKSQSPQQSEGGEDFFKKHQKQHW